MIESDVTDERLRILLAQLDGAWEMLDARLTGRRPWGEKSGKPTDSLTDAEYFWEPVPGCWSLRRTGETVGPKPVGHGEWLLENGSPEPQPPPFTTIAWRMCHIAMWERMRYDYTFGDHSLTLDDFVWPSTAEAAVTFLRSTHQQWREALQGLTSPELEQVGRSRMPYGWDPEVRFVDLLAWTNTEFTHHAAEIGCLRDLYRAEGGTERTRRLQENYTGALPGVYGSPEEAAAYLSEERGARED